MYWGDLHLYNEIFEIRNLKGIFFCFMIWGDEAMSHIKKAWWNKSA